MQIHELNNFAGTPTSSDYLAIDNSTTTTKIGATGLGVQDKLTVAEANTGTSTSSRIVTPKVVHDYVVQDTTHITSATISSWASKTGNDGSINDIASYLLANFPIIEIGEESMGSVPAGGSVTASITFTANFTSTPTVVASYRGGTPQYMNASVTSPSQTGMTLVAGNFGTTARNATISWIAIQI